MSRVVVLLFMLALPFCANAQKPDSAAVRNWWKNSGYGVLSAGGFSIPRAGELARREGLYRLLADRLQKADTTLNFEERAILYYGSAYRDDYDAGARDAELEAEVSTLAWCGLPKKAYDRCITYLKQENPVSLRVLGLARSLAQQLGLSPEIQQKHKTQIGILANLIVTCANGSPDYPYIITDFADQDIVLTSLFAVTDKTPADEALYREIDGTWTPLQAVRIDTPTPLCRRDTVWFDVTYPLGYFDARHGTRFSPWKPRIKTNEEN